MDVTQPSHQLHCGIEKLGTRLKLRNYCKKGNRHYRSFGYYDVSDRVQTAVQYHVCKGISCQFPPPYPLQAPPECWETLESSIQWGTIHSSVNEWLCKVMYLARKSLQALWVSYYHIHISIPMWTTVHVRVCCAMCTHAKKTLLLWVLSGLVLSGKVLYAKWKLV